MVDAFQHPILIKLANLNLPVEDFAVMGGGCLLVKGLIEDIQDVDIIARGQAWEVACKMGNILESRSGVGQLIIIDEDIEAYNRWFPGDWNIAS